MKRRFSSQFLGMNSIMVYQGKIALLIDPGVFPPEVTRIKEFMDRERISEVSVLLTHTHGDHISGWNAFQELPVYGHRCIEEKSQTVRNNDVRYLQGMYRKQGYTELDQLVFPHSLRIAEEGQFINQAPFSFAFFHVPGHSTDMTAIVIPCEKLLCSGDMLIQTPVPFILHSIPQYWSSLNRLEELVLQFDLECLIPGHGKPAKTRDEILLRIRQEREYVQRLVLAGAKYSSDNRSADEIKSLLYDHFPRFKNLHSHQANVQTFLRERIEIMAGELIAKFSSFHGNTIQN